MTNDSPLLHSRSLHTPSGSLLNVTPARAGWDYVGFSVHRLAAGETWTARTGGNEVCLVLLEGLVAVTWTPGRPTAIKLGPRRDVFTDYPHAVYLPPRTTFTITAVRQSEIASCRAANAERHEAFVIRPQDCGFEIRGGGNATRQIIDILPPSAPAHRLLVCEVLTPSGNWSSYPPHKHDVHAPPDEVALEETYYYRFKQTAGYGIQRLYTANGRTDATYGVRHGDVLLIRDGYHPFVAAPGCDAYYLNTLAGSARSLASADDPQFAYLRLAWPPPDPRVPVIERPAAPSKRRRH